MTKMLLSVGLVMMATHSFASDQEHWITDMEQAQKIAQREHKDIFMFYTGSDWCGWCNRLVEEVFEHKEFLDYAEKNFVMVELDFPSDEDLITEQQLAHNEKWRERFPVKGYPTVFLTDSNINRYAETGYRPGGPGKYVEFLTKVADAKSERDELLAQAANAKGVVRAKLLDKTLHIEHVMNENRDEMIDQIISLTPADMDMHKQYATIKGNLSLTHDLEQLFPPLHSPAVMAKEEVQRKLKGCQSLMEQYAYLKSGEPLFRLVYLTGSYYSKSGNDSAAREFYQNVYADQSYSTLIRQLVAIRTAVLKASTEGEDAAITALDAAIAMDPESRLVQNRKQLLNDIHAQAEQYKDLNKS